MVGLRFMTLVPVRTIAPVMLPVSLEEAKAHVGAGEFSDDNIKIEGYLNAAIEYLDGRGVLGQALISQTWRNDFGGFDCRLRLSPGPVSSVTTVTYYDGSNVQQTLSTSVYRLLTDELGPYIVTKPGQVWPSAYCREDAVSVTFVAGFGTLPSSVPAPVRAAILLLTAHLYENREPVNIGNITTDLPFSLAALISNYRRVGF